MGHLFIGHGGLTPENYTYQEGMDIVAIPPGTTLQFYSDAGQSLQGTFSAVWSQLQAPWPALTSDDVTYNFILLSYPERKIQALYDAVVADSTHTPHLPGMDLGDPAILCTGAAGQCPTDPREQRPHTCDGLLAQYSGELHWIACTSFMWPETEEDRARAGMTEAEVGEALMALRVARGDAPPSVFLGSDPDSWDEHEQNLMTRLTDMMDLYVQIGTPAEFVKYFYGSAILAEEREVLLQQPSITEFLRTHG